MADQGNWEDMVDEIQANDDAGLDDWQLQFIEDMSNRKGTRLSTKQLAKIEQIWQQVFAR